MATAAAKADVGPMATVAGAIASAGIEAMIGAGARFGVIDNGGDIALVSDRDVRVGVHAGTAPLSDKVAFVIPPQKEPFGICTSSATVGPSLSFGVADAVTIFAPDPLLADAWATAVCNRIRTDDRSVLSQPRSRRGAGCLCHSGRDGHPMGPGPARRPGPGQRTTDHCRGPAITSIRNRNCCLPLHLHRKMFSAGPSRRSR